MRIFIKAISSIYSPGCASRETSKTSASSSGPSIRSNGRARQQNISIGNASAKQLIHQMLRPINFFTSFIKCDTKLVRTKILQHTRPSLKDFTKRSPDNPRDRVPSPESRVPSPENSRNTSDFRPSSVLENPQLPNHLTLKILKRLPRTHRTQRLIRRRFVQPARKHRHRRSFLLTLEQGEIRSVVAAGNEEPMVVGAFGGIQIAERARRPRIEFAVNEHDALALRRYPVVHIVHGGVRVFHLDSGRKILLQRIGMLEQSREMPEFRARSAELGGRLVKIRHETLEAIVVIARRIADIR